MSAKLVSIATVMIASSTHTCGCTESWSRPTTSDQCGRTLWWVYAWIQKLFLSTHCRTHLCSCFPDTCSRRQWLTGELRYVHPSAVLRPELNVYCTVLTSA